MEKNVLYLVFLFKTYTFYCYFCLLVLNLYILLSLDRAAVDSDGVMVFLPSPCQAIAQNYISRVSLYVVYTNFTFVQH